MWPDHRASSSQDFYFYSFYVVVSMLVKYVAKQKLGRPPLGAHPDANGRVIKIYPRNDVNGRSRPLEDVLNKRARNNLYHEIMLY
jgi:hypothetical protein